MSEKVFSLFEVTTAFFAEQDATAITTAICNFHLVASRDAAHHGEETLLLPPCRPPCQLEPLLEHANFSILDSSNVHTLTPQLQSDLVNSRSSQAVGQCCASVLPEQEPESWAANLCSPVQKALIAKYGRVADVLKLLLNMPVPDN